VSAQAIPLTKKAPANLRPFDIRRDLLAVADLVELCFAQSLDADGRLYIRQMRQAARNRPLLDLAAAGSGRVDLPMGGFVWVEDGQVVGNLSLIPHATKNQRIYLIANVAVHPDFRRHGVAHELTRAALAEVKRKGPFDTWLQVDENNAAAVKLYSDMGFIEQTRRTSWRAHPQPELSAKLATAANVRWQRASDWNKQKAWLANSYPANIRWHLPLDMVALQPGLRGAFERLFGGREVRQWTAERKNKVIGVLSWQSSSLENDRLWLATDAVNEDEAITALMRNVHNNLRRQRSLALNYERARGQEALLAAGFHAARTLIWMDYPWRK
jgi:ribosomal protein S18 acetylase RimI-like enzyme